VSLDFGLGRQAPATTREPEDLPAIASLFRWTGQSNGTVNRAVTRLVRGCSGGPSDDAVPSTLAGLSSCGRAVLRLCADRNPDDDAQRRDHHRPRADPGREGDGHGHRHHPRRDGAPAAAHRRGSAALGARCFRAAIGSARQPDLCVRARLQCQSRRRADRRHELQRSLDAERGDRLRASAHRQPRPYRGGARADEHALRLGRDRRRDQHGHQEGFGSADRRRLCRDRHAPANQRGRLCSRQRRPVQLQHQRDRPLCPGRVDRPAALHAARRLRRPRRLSQHQPRVAAGLRHQRQQPAHLVQPLHRHPREIRSGGPGRSQRHGVHAAVLQSPAVRR